MKLRNVLLLVGLSMELVVLSLTIPNAEAQTETILHSFGVSANDGKGPTAGLVQGRDGNFYGTTFRGGISDNGTVFRISPSGSYTNLHSFAGYPTSGYGQDGGLVQGSDSNFYGTTYQGGANNSGTVFRISPSGGFTNLYSFAGYPNDGANPSAGLVQGSDGNFYGTTYQGGSKNDGTVFRISPSGSYTTLYSFGISPTDGGEPQAGLVQGSDGNFYGTTSAGGQYGYGTVFRISPTGSITNLHSIVGRQPGPHGGYYEYRVAGLVQGSDGNFYGTSSEADFGYDGTSGYGTVFRISPNGSYTNLYSFNSNGFTNDGRFPLAGLVQGSDGNFYGTTLQGGTNSCYGGDNSLGGCGTVFRISSSGTYTSLYSFGNIAGDGVNPYAGLVQGSDGSFYGTTYGGGAGYTGTVFKLSVPLSPPANQIAGLQVLSVYDMSYAAILIPSVANETYQLQYSDSMSPANWINSGDPLVSIGGPVTFFDFVESTTSQRFYRFAITP